MRVLLVDSFLKLAADAFQKASSNFFAPLTLVLQIFDLQVVGLHPVIFRFQNA